MVDTLLLRAGCNKALLEVAEEGKTEACGALHAAGWGQGDVLRALVAAGAQVDCKNSNGKRRRRREPGFRINLLVVLQATCGLPAI
eukprot:364999-Prorocentrum_minimum.AAC.1